MFQKIITADGLDTINFAIIQELQELGIPDILHTKYRVEALLNYFGTDYTRCEQGYG